MDKQTKFGTAVFTVTRQAIRDSYVNTTTKK